MDDDQKNGHTQQPLVDDGDMAYGVAHMLLRLAGLNPSAREELVIMAARVGKLFNVTVA